MAGVLKNIKFKDVTVQVLGIEHGARVLVTWELEPTAQRLNNLKFFVDRGESPAELQQLNAEGLPATGLKEFLDQTANLIDLNKVYYYRVRAVEFQGTTPVQTFNSEPETWDGDLDLVGLYVVDEHIFAHRWVHGVPAMVFKKKKDAAVCPECWDSVMKRVTKSNCKTCFGTGKLGGYYAPIEVWMTFEPDPKIEQVVDWGKRQESQTDIMFTNYPLLVPDDVIFEVRENKFWKVSNVRAPEKNRTIMLQMARLSAVYPTDIEYKIEVPDDRQRALVKELEAREKETEF